MLSCRTIVDMHGARVCVYGKWSTYSEDVYILWYTFYDWFVCIHVQYAGQPYGQYGSYGQMGYWGYPQGYSQMTQQASYMQPYMQQGYPYQSYGYVTLVFEIFKPPPLTFKFF